MSEGTVDQAEVRAVSEATKTIRPPFEPGLYIHYKEGLYKALFLATDSNSPSKDRLLVIYVSLSTGVIFSRPLYNEDSSWSDEILIEKGPGQVEWVPRFKLVKSVLERKTAENVG